MHTCIESGIYSYYDINYLLENIFDLGPDRSLLLFEKLASLYFAYPFDIFNIPENLKVYLRDLVSALQFVQETKIPRLCILIYNIN